MQHLVPKALVVMGGKQRHSTHQLLDVLYEVYPGLQGQVQQASFRAGTLYLKLYARVLAYEMRLHQASLLSALQARLAYSKDLIDKVQKLTFS